MREGWEYKKLGEVCNILNGYAFKSSKYTNSGTRIIRITNVQKGYVIDNDPKYYSDDDIKNLTQYSLREGDLVMSLTGNVGRVGMLQKSMLPAALNQRVACIRTKSDEISLNYLFHLFNSDVFERAAIRSARGIAQLNMSTEWLKEHTIPLPPKSTQLAIVSELDKIKELIRLKKEQLKDFDNLAQSIFYEMFGDPVENDKGWEVMKLNEIVSDDCSISYGIVQPGDGVENGVPVVCPVDMTETFISRQGLKNTTKEISDSYKRTILKGDEILMCVRGTTGLVAMASPELRGCNVTRGITPIECGPSCNKWFIYYQISNPSIQQHIAEYTRGITLKQINMKDVREIPLCLPPLPLQHLFAQCIEQIEHQKAEVQKAIIDLETLLAARMQYWFE